MKRGIIIVLDSVGIGAQPDAGLYGDEGSNTLGHIHKELKDLPWFSLANLERLGLGYIDGVDYLNKSHPAIGSFARMMELSKGKDTTTGHWEIAGIVLDKPFPVYPDGFPAEIIQSFEEAIGRKTLGNYPASGTQIIAELGAEHMKPVSPLFTPQQTAYFRLLPMKKLYP